MNVEKKHFKRKDFLPHSSNSGKAAAKGEAKAKHKQTKQAKE